MMTKISYSGYRFPPEIIQQAIWLYLRFTLSLRDIEDLLAERGIMVSYDQNTRCRVSSVQGQPKDFSQRTQPLTTLSTSNAISPQLNLTACSAPRQ